MIDNFYSLFVFLSNCVEMCGQACVRACLHALGDKGYVAVLQEAWLYDSHSETTGEERTAAPSLKYWAPERACERLASSSYSHDPSLSPRQLQWMRIRSSGTQKATCKKQHNKEQLPSPPLPACIENIRVYSLCSIFLLKHDSGGNVGNKNAPGFSLCLNEQH